MAAAYEMSGKACRAFLEDAELYLRDAGRPGTNPDRAATFRMLYHAARFAASCPDLLLHDAEGTLSRMTAAVLEYYDSLKAHPSFPLLAEECRIDAKYLDCLRKETGKQH